MGFAIHQLLLRIQSNQIHSHPICSNFSDRKHSTLPWWIVSGAEAIDSRNKNIFMDWFWFVFLDVVFCWIMFALYASNACTHIVHNGPHANKRVQQKLILMENPTAQQQKQQQKWVLLKHLNNAKYYWTISENFNQH